MRERSRRPRVTFLPPPLAQGGERTRGLSEEEFAVTRIRDPSRRTPSIASDARIARDRDVTVDLGRSCDCRLSGGQLRANGKDGRRRTIDLDRSRSMRLPCHSVVSSRRFSRTSVLARGASRKEERREESQGGHRAARNAAASLKGSAKRSSSRDIQARCTRRRDFHPVTGGAFASALHLPHLCHLDFPFPPWDTADSPFAPLVARVRRTRVRPPRAAFSRLRVPFDRDRWRERRRGSE